ncbi:uncharacterized protein GGS22DRAFT_21847 [Annulohypoxylon maeteangense]|uniref:uncharacterized protein n=1 Tax=Annulohypoxylon maeteangense TaxID=1927788 RepID=UPI002007545B|nr:uncharacterized protein GGS22DRAFT_21847 [Annulohypoxylon maeteangense]KAI0884318.1 hypothetical protein GGS22DRAFT_21847 [Annulohypoxylon maeteangense]
MSGHYSKVPDWQVPQDSENKMDGISYPVAGQVGFDFDGNERRESVVGLNDDDVQDVEMADSPMTLTPNGRTPVDPHTSSSRAFARPITRSMGKISTIEPLEALSYTTTSLRARLQTSSKKHLPTLNISKLEDSKDIKYVVGDEAIVRSEDGDQISPSLEKLLREHREIGQLGMSVRRSARIGDHQGQAIDLNSASTALVKSRLKRVGVKRARANPINRYPRRSSRLWKPLTEFPQYARLPAELKMMIWEAAIEPRLLYICNRSSIMHAGTAFGAQNSPPKWFNTCQLSRFISRLHYQKRFGIQDPLVANINVKTIQDFNSNDVVIFEPCHGACRGCHCARHQYCEGDRSAVRYLAVQTESPHLPGATEPCWQTITRSWPNVETLYLMRVPLKGVDKQEKAMIRVQANELEVALLRRFEQWKKAQGKYMKVNQLEFVEVVQKEDATTNPQHQYRSVLDRLTGFPEDVILG